jgi:hypothetical protein
MRVTLKEEGLLCISLFMPCWHINEETHLPIGVHTQKPLQLEGETCPPWTNHNKNHLSPNYNYHNNPMKKNSPWNQINLVGWWWQCLSTCRHHWLITQCQFHNAKTIVRGWKNMGLLLQNMKSHIFCNGYENIFHNIVRGRPLPPCAWQKKWMGKANNKCNVTPQVLKDGKYPT